MEAKKTDILCPDCFKGKLIEVEKDRLVCEICKMRYYFTDREKNCFRYE